MNSNQKKRFKPEDFTINNACDTNFIILEGATKELLAKIANAKLDEWEDAESAEAEEILNKIQFYSGE